MVAKQETESEKAQRLDDIRERQRIAKQKSRDAKYALGFGPASVMVPRDCVPLMLLIEKRLEARVKDGRVVVLSDGQLDSGVSRFGPDQIERLVDQMLDGLMHGPGMGAYPFREALEQAGDERHPPDGVADQNQDRHLARSAPGVIAQKGWTSPRVEILGPWEEIRDQVPGGAIDFSADALVTSKGDYIAFDQLPDLIVSRLQDVGMNGESEDAKQALINLMMEIESY